MTNIDDYVSGHEDEQMTNESAIKELKMMLTDNSNTRAMYDALKLAIKALSCSEKPNNSDLISRQDAIDVLEVFTQKDALGYTPKQIVEALPPAQPERKKGKCIWCDSPYRIEYYWIDNDGYTASYQDEERHLVATGVANYCPNCGRLMENEEE